MEIEQQIVEEIEKRQEQINQEFERAHQHHVNDYINISDVKGLMKILDHISNCDNINCPDNCRQLLLVAEENLRRKGLQFDLLAIAFLNHASLCNSNTCKISFGGKVIHFCKHLNRERRKNIKEMVSQQHPFDGSVVYSNTTWFSKGDAIIVPLSYNIFMEYKRCACDHENDQYALLVKENVKYAWLAKGNDNAAIAVKKIPINQFIGYKNDLHRLVYVDSPYILLPQLIVANPNENKCLSYMKNVDCSLRDYLNDFHLRGERLPQPVALTYIFQLISALSSFHENGIAHNNVNSSNVVLTDNCQNLMLIDFRHLKDEEEIFHIPLSVSGYFPPQVVAKNQLYAKETDIYNLGIVVGEILLCDQISLLADPNYQNVILDGIRQSNYPNTLKNMVENCLQNDAMERPTASELKFQYFNDHSTLTIERNKGEIFPPFSKYFDVQSYIDLDKVIINRSIVHLMQSLPQHLPYRTVSRLDKFMEFLEC